MSVAKRDEHLRMALKWARKGEYAKAQASVLRASEADYVSTAMLDKINEALRKNPKRA